MLRFQRTTKSKACKHSCHVTQPVPPPKAGSPSATWDQKESAPHHSSISWAEGVQPGQKAFVATRRGIFNQTGKIFFFSWKGEPEFSSFKGRRMWEEGHRKERALFESCCGKDEPAGSFPPLPVTQYYNSIRKGHSSIQISSYEITLHLVLIRRIQTRCNSSCIRKQNKLVDFHPG